MRLVRGQQQQPHQQQQQDAGTAGGAAATTSSSSSSTAGSPCAELLMQWRADGLPEPEVAWKVGSSSANGSSSSRGSLLLPAGAAAAAAAGLSGASLLLPESPQDWLVLGIESSCDDTAAAVVKGDGTVLSHQIASQVSL
jgi:hypothetical protein